MREVVAPVDIAAHAHDQQRHLLVLVQQVPVGAVFYGFGVHGAGVYRAHGLFKHLIALFKRALIRAEHAFVLAHEAVAEAVLQYRA